ncbi:MAG TPA: energy-coupling factor transporter ATPase [Clostridiales bacterium]|nr:energy-coupling factor transporter ATPase [Clostridiales bacterium]
MSIETVDLTHVYMPGTERAVVAVDRVSLRIDDGETVGIMGPTGSGKSTLIQHFNGLLRPTSGRVLVDGEDLWPREKEGPRTTDLHKVRRKVGLIFQFPEHQLFEESVYDDVAFGPRNLGLSEEEVRRRVTVALRMVGVPEDEAEALGRRSPFSLSGGQMRRVAIAGVLAMRPATLVLDEPTAGLDPRGRLELLETLSRLHRRWGLTLVVVSHNMEDLAALVDRVIILDQGRLILDGPTREVFRDPESLRRLGLDAPPVVALMHALAARGAQVDVSRLSPREAAEEIDQWIRAGRPRRAGSGREGDAGLVHV